MQSFGLNKEKHPNRFLPFMVLPLAASVVALVQNVLLGKSSPEALRIAAGIIYLMQALQIACVSCANMTQGHVSRWSGEKNIGMIGSGVWQMIWFSVLSTLVTVPIAVYVGHLYFSHLPVKREVMTYYYFITATNFLYPLGAVLSNLYLGIKRIKFVICTVVGFSLLQMVFFSFLVIPFGLWGLAVSLLVVQGGYCLFLFLNFLSDYRDASWALQPKLLWNNIRTGLGRAIHATSSWGAWAMVAYIMLEKSPTHGYVFAVGSTLYLGLNFIPQAILLVSLSNVSHYLGSKRYDLIVPFLKYIYVRILLAAIVLGAVCLLASQWLFGIFFATIPLSPMEVSAVFMQFWIFFCLLMLNAPMLGSLMALQDAKFLFWMGCAPWLLECAGCLTCYRYFQIPAHYFWMVMGGCLVIHQLLCTGRFVYLTRRLVQAL